jgi:hypothetical protein
MAITASFCGAQSAMGSTGVVVSAAAIPPPLAPAIRMETVGTGGAEGGATVGAVATKDAQLAAWIGIPTLIFLRRFRFIPV